MKAHVSLDRKLIKYELCSQFDMTCTKYQNMQLYYDGYGSKYLLLYFLQRCER